MSALPCRNPADSLARRAQQIFDETLQGCHVRADRNFAFLMLLQWGAAVGLALTISPFTWIGEFRAIHEHVWDALIFGGLATIIPVVLALLQPGRVRTRHAVAVGQALMSAMLIHITNGRIETHFHIFVSLAFLAFYRDWRVLITASAVTAADHFLRGSFLPISVFGVEAVSQWRWIEHAGWVVLEDIFLIISIGQSLAAMREMAERQARLEAVNEEIECQVAQRTAELSSEIAERRAAEMTLRESQAQLAEAQRLAHMGSWDWDLITNELNWSDELYRISGRTRDEVAGMIDGFWSCVHPEDEPLIRRHLEQSIATNTPFDCNYRMVRPDGTVRTLHSRGVVAVNGDGQPRRIYGAVQDITDRRTAEEEKERLLVEVKQQRKRLDDILATVPGVVWEAWGDPACQQLNFVNDHVEKLLGYSVDEWLATPNFWLTRVHPDDRERSAREAAAIFAEGKGGTMLFRWVHRESHWLWVETHVAVVCDEAGAPVGMRGVTLDVTSRKNAEADLDATQQKLLSASRQAGMAEVATSVLHNVGNVLNSVNISVGVAAEKVGQTKARSLSRLAALLRDHAENLPAFFANHPQGARLPQFLGQLAEQFATDQKTVLGELESLRINIEHINEIVAMQQSYATAGGVIEVLPPAHLVEDALRMNSAAFDRHGTHVVRDFDSALPPIAVDRNKVLLILVNLIRNAKFACDDSGRGDKSITVRTYLHGCGLARISVSDNGIGIPRENLTRIFEHGFTTRKSGHGFGLHSSALAAADMGGSLRAQSDGPGTGATFTIEIPLSPDSK